MLVCPLGNISIRTAKSYTEITVTGEDAQHSDLPTNDEVVDLIKQHIEGQGLRKKQKTKLEPH